MLYYSWCMLISLMLRTLTLSVSIGIPIMHDSPCLAGGGWSTAGVALNFPSRIRLWKVIDLHCHLMAPICPLFKFLKWLSCQILCLWTFFWKLGDWVFFHEWATLGHFPWRTSSQDAICRWVCSWKTHISNICLPNNLGFIPFRKNTVFGVWSYELIT